MIARWNTAVLLLAALSSSVLAGERLPSDSDIAAARQRNSEALARIPVSTPSPTVGTVPKVEAMPKPNAAPMDIEKIAEQYKTISQPQPKASGSSADLMVFVSFSMPRGALERTVEQAETSGATLVFRGLQDDSMQKMAGAVKELIGNHKVGVVIHPPAFQQFSVARVPAVVIAKSEAGSVMENGCSQENTFVKVTGDVTIEYALEHIERHSPEWAALASSYRKKFKGFLQ